MSRDVPTTATRKPWRVLLCAATAAGLALGAAACSDELTAPAAEVPEAEAGVASLARLDCVVQVASGAVECTAPVAAGGARRAIIGGQNQYVRLASTHGGYDAAAQEYTINVTVQNLLRQAMGTADGVNLHTEGVRVFFHTAPTATEGSGVVDVANETGADLFLGAEQPYFQYSEVLAKDEVSPAQPWRFSMPATVTRFAFSVYVQTELEPRLIVTEVMANPAGVSTTGPIQDADGEYVEILNAGLVAVNLKGFVIQDGSSNQTSTTCVVSATNNCSGSASPGVPLTIPVDLFVPPGKTALLVRSATASLNGGLVPDYAYGAAAGSALNLGNTQCNGGTGCITDFFRIRTPSLVTLDSVAYRLVATSTTNGVARELVNPELDNANLDGGNWAAATATYFTTSGGVANRGTPTNTGGASSGGGGPVGQPGVPAGVSISINSPAQVPEGYTKPAFATVRDGAGAVMTPTPALTWTSSDNAVATVDTLGYITGHAVGTVTIRATTSNGATGTASFSVIAATATTSAIYRNHVEFGDPVDATPADEYRIGRAQFVASYNPNRGSPNWVAWNINASQFGAAPRCDCFTAEATLPAGAIQAVDFDYRNGGYDRGHMVQSESRTTTHQENAATFLLSNILPQAGNNNQGPWGQFELYLNGLARDSAMEVYVIAGGQYDAAPPTLKNAGRIPIPHYTWKVAVILPAGQGLSSVNSASDLRVIAIRMPNLITTPFHTVADGDPASAAGIRTTPWASFRTTVDSIEAATGYDLLAALSTSIQEMVEANP